MSDHPITRHPLPLPVSAWLTVDCNDGISLHHSAESATQAAVVRHGIVHELTPITEQLRTTHRLAAVLVLAQIEADCVTHKAGDQVWHDTAYLLEPWEQGPRTIDLHTAMLQWALDAGLIARHPTDTDLVRITPLGLRVTGAA